MDIHSQYETLNLAKNEYQLKVLDSYCGHQHLLEHFLGGFPLVHLKTTTEVTVIEE